MFTTQGGQQERWLPYGHQTCRDDPTKLGYTIASISWMILCPLTLPPQNPVGPTEEDRNRDYKLVANSNIEMFSQITSMTILHELFHVVYAENSK